MKIRVLSLVLALLSFSSLASGNVVAVENCRATAVAVSEAREAARPAYVLGVRDRAHLITFGLEVEFEPQGRNPKILEDYRPSSYSTESWSPLSLDQRVSIFKGLDFSRDEIHLVKFQGPTWMPLRLENDISGNKEANNFVFESFDQLQEMLAATESRYGRGAAQVHVVFRFDPALAGQAGFIAFSGDRAQLKNLESGFAKFLKDPTKIPGKTLKHFAMAPMDNVGLELTRANENIISSGKRPGLLVWESRRYFSTVFRIDKYKDAGSTEKYPDMGLVGYELRQFNYDYEGLMDETSLVAGVLEKGAIKSFAKFDRDTSDVLHELLNRENLSIWYQALMKVETGQRKFLEPYFYGFRNWADHPILESLPPEAAAALRIKIRAAQRQMFKEFISALKRTGSFNLVKDELSVSLAKFAATIQLGPLFDQYYKDVIDSE